MRSLIRECNCRLLSALYWWAEGCDPLQVAAPCYWEMQLQIARRQIMVWLNWCVLPRNDAVGNKMVREMR